MRCNHFVFAVVVVAAAHPLAAFTEEWFASNLKAFEMLSYNELLVDCVGEDYMRLFDVTLARAADDCMANRSSTGTNKSLVEFQQMSISRIIENSFKERNIINGNNDRQEAKKNNDNQVDQKNEDRQTERADGNNEDNRGVNREGENDQRDRNLGDFPPNKDAKDYMENRIDGDRQDDRDRSEDRRESLDYTDCGGDGNDDDCRNERDLPDDGGGYMETKKDSVTKSSGNTERDTGTERREREKYGIRTKDTKRERNYGYGFNEDDDEYNTAESDDFFRRSDFAFENDFFYRKKRNSFRPDLTSISDLITREIAIDEKFRNFICILRRRTEIMESDEIRFLLGSTFQLDDKLRGEFVDALRDCTDKVNCLEGMYRNSEIFPAALRRILEQQKCEQKQLRLICIKNDLRKLLPNLTSGVNGTMSIIFDELLSKLFDIVSFDGEPQSYGLI